VLSSCGRVRPRGAQGLCRARPSSRSSARCCDGGQPLALAREALPWNSGCARTCSC
jgi:hypothetical protein